jgi:ABC-type multidrug transport system fused ATPase/permease subunit
MKRAPMKGGIRGLLTTLELLGVRSLRRRLLLLSTVTFISGLAQAALLVILSELAVSSAQRRKHLVIEGHSLSIEQALLLGLVLLAIFFAAGMITASATSSISGISLEEGRNTMIDAFFDADWSVQAEERLGHVQQLLTVNCEDLAVVVLAMANGLQSLLTVLALLLAAFLVNPIVAGGVLIVGMLLYLLLRPINAWTRRASGQLAEDSQTMATLVTEYTRLARDFRLFGVKDPAKDQLHVRNGRAARSFRRNRHLGLLIPVVYQTFALGFVVVGLAVLASRGGNALGATAAVVLLVLRSLTYGANIQATSQQLHSYEAFLDGLTEELDRYHRGKEKEDGICLPMSFSIEFDNVSFSYDESKDVLHDISFNVPEGQLLGIVGRSGSGKTTVSQLLLGLRRPSRGNVMIGDVPSSKIVSGEGISPIALVAQEPVLLQGSIAWNIAFFRAVSQEEIESAALAAHLHDEISMMPNGYATTVGEGGAALSGGQRQRLAIARALIGRPRLLLLDEPTSALDRRSEQLLRETLAELRGRVTVVVISHRLATIEDCDLLLVLEKGRVADFGPSRDVQAGEGFKRATHPAPDTRAATSL